MAASNNIISQSISFCRESLAELKKVHTPTRPETILLTLRVLMMVCVFGIFLGLTDLFVGRMMQWVLT